MSIKINPFGWTDPRGIYGAGGNLVGAMNTTTHQNPIVSVDAPLIIKVPNETPIDVRQEILRMRYILQRTVPNYDELVTQFNAIEDIKGAEQWDK